VHTFTKSYLKQISSYLIRFGYDEYLAYAAGFALLLALACWTLGPHVAEEEPLTPPTSQNILAEAMLHAVTRVNNSGEDQVIRLKDGSTVQLATGGSISFPKDYGKDRRIVTLAGSAVFNVKEDRRKPFLVYAGATVVKAQGTNFLEKAINKDSLISISVKSGAVSVFKAEDFDNVEMKAQEGRSGVQLTMLEKAIFNKKKQILTKIK
jgi:ferric-dicitrate binding protein FerR (iron transport regulator)